MSEQCAKKHTLKRILLLTLIPIRIVNMTAKNLEYRKGRVQEKTIEEGNLPENAPPVNSSIPPEYITLLTSGDDLSSTALSMCVILLFITYYFRNSTLSYFPYPNDHLFSNLKQKARKIYFLYL